MTACVFACESVQAIRISPINPAKEIEVSTDDPESLVSINDFMERLGPARTIRLRVLDLYRTGGRSLSVVVEAADDVTYADVELAIRLLRMAAEDLLAPALPPAAGERG